jgi:hypothetical protein
MATSLLEGWRCQNRPLSRAVCAQQLTLGWFRPLSTLCPDSCSVLDKTNHPSRRDSKTFRPKKITPMGSKVALFPVPPPCAPAGAHQVVLTWVPPCRVSH